MHSQDGLTRVKANRRLRLYADPVKTRNQTSSKRVIALLSLLLAALASNSAAQDYATDLEVSKTVGPTVPSDPMQPVEFEITVTNLGPETANQVFVVESLPDGLGIPEGTGAFVSSGLFNPNTGEWFVGNLAPQASAVMTLPAIVTETPQPACLVNKVSLRGDDKFESNNVARAAVRKNETERCVAFRVSASRPFGSTTPCGGAGKIDYDLDVRNLGPDTARDVQLTVTETSAFKLPGFRLNDTDCEGLTCTWDEIPAGGWHIVRATSDSFKNKKEQTHEMLLQVTSEDEIWDTGHNTNTRRDIGRFNVPCPDYGVPAPWGGGGGGGCFIATAAYGTALDPRLDILRDFRDEWLLRAPGGEHLVAAYYRWSPPLAEYIAERPAMRALVRGLLVPVLLLVSYPGASLFATLLVLAGILARRRYLLGLGG